MYNRYDGSTGKVLRVEDTPDRAPTAGSRPAQRPSAQNNAPPKKTVPPEPMLSSFTDKLMKLVTNTISELENEDYILLLILYLMYRESRDEELLFAMIGYLL